MIDRLSRLVVLALLRRVGSGRIEMAERGRRIEFGPPDSSLRARVVVHDERAWRGCLAGSLGLGETYVEGLWETDDLVTLLRIAAREIGAPGALRRTVGRVRSLAHRLRRLVPGNSREAARRNISAHYDLGNELFSAFLDQRMMYSCALWERPEMTLEEAQEAKLNRICEKLALGPADHLLEIGSGWGGLAVHAASRWGCQVTTTTISREQHELALDRVRAAGMEDRVTVLLEDYRDLEGSYDKVVSIEMIEAVGWRHFDEFFARCDALLAPGGLMLLQAITIDDDLYESEKATRSFANTHIFPGGCLPSKHLISSCLQRVTRMRQVWAEDITASYPPTLAAWRERFLDAWAQLHVHGYDDRFRRLWTFYLSSSEAGFREGRIGDVQELFEKAEGTSASPGATGA